MVGVPRRVVIALAVVLLALVAAVAAVLLATPRGNGDTFVGRLALVPSEAVSPGGILVNSADLQRTAEIAGVERPVGDAGVEAHRAYLDALIRQFDAPGGTPRVAAQLPNAANPGDPDNSPAFRQEVGWSLGDVAWFTEVGNNQRRNFSALGGDFDEGGMTGAMGRPVDGIWSLGGADGTTDPANASAARPEGQSLRLALDGDQLYAGTTTPPVRAALDGPEQTLADDPRLLQLAGALDAEGCYAGIMETERSFALAENVYNPTPERLVALQAHALPQPFQGLAVGLGWEEGAPYGVVAYVHADDAAAQANAEALPGLVASGLRSNLEDPWSQLFTVERVRAGGGLVVARLGLPGGDPRFINDALFEAETLVLHR